MDVLKLLDALVRVILFPLYKRNIKREIISPETSGSVNITSATQIVLIMGV